MNIYTQAGSFLQGAGAYELNMYVPARTTITCLSAISPPVERDLLHKLLGLLDLLK